MPPPWDEVPKPLWVFSQLIWDCYIVASDLAIRQVKRLFILQQFQINKPQIVGWASPTTLDQWSVSRSDGQCPSYWKSL
ncbi:MAG: hypothetical protein HC865_02465 [Cyanobacteria bacterium RU_5_0]|nr:hypothetical protein [Cyanobacteria bacterium RU_5_0]